jgi:hypothetical protein
MTDKVYQEENSFFYSDGNIYDLNTIFKLTHSLPIVKIDTSKLIWVLKYNKNIDDDRVNKADLSTPILVWKTKERELVVDGLHRLMKARKLGIKYISYKRVTDKIMKQALKTHPLLKEW